MENIVEFFSLIYNLKKVDFYFLNIAGKNWILHDCVNRLST